MAEPRSTDATDVWRVELGEADAKRLTDEERGRAAQIRTEAGRTRWIAARAALRTILAGYLDTDPANVPLRFGPYGKPELALDPLPLRFNLSHSKDLALVALSAEHEVGIDVERIDPERRLVRLARIGLNHEAATAVRTANAEERPRVFYAAWTRREAIVKCLGVGLGRSHSSEPGVTVVDLDPGPGYAGAIAQTGESPIHLRRLDFRG
jgi:4'-phosphopantetheinyl transferase